MRTAALGLLLALAAVFASDDAFAHRRSHVQFGFHFGAPLYWHSWHPWWYYPPPAYYYPPAVYVPAQPTTYIEQGTSSAPAADPGGWWYYCDTARGYYPYVKECPSGWQRVPPAPPPAK
jgi:hypothetical protein